MDTVRTAKSPWKVAGPETDAGLLVVAQSAQGVGCCRTCRATVEGTAVVAVVAAADGDVVAVTEDAAAVGLGHGGGGKRSWGVAWLS